MYFIEYIFRGNIHIKFNGSLQIIKFRLSEKATKMWPNLAISFDF